MKQLAGPKAMLLRVGLDRGTGGALGPIFGDGTFEYVPIPEVVPTRSAVTYSTLPGRHIASLGSVLPARLGKRHPHLDPDFAAALYGDAASHKRRQLLRLAPGDLIVFYAGLTHLPPEGRPRLFAVGSLRVRQVHDLRPDDLDRPELQAGFGRTAHFLRQTRDPELALVEGEPAEGRLFARAIPLADGRDCLLTDLAPLGYEGSLLRSVGHWINGLERIRFLENWLRSGPADLVGTTTRLVPTASGPEAGEEGDLVFEDRRLRAGDWIVALPGGKREHALVFGRVNRIASGGKRALSSLYWFFSGPGPDASDVTLPLSSLRAVVTDRAKIRRLVTWFETRYRIGVHFGA